MSETATSMRDDDGKRRQIQVYVPLPVFQAARLKAAKERIPLSEWVRRLIAKGLK